ncbi:MAG: serine protease [Rhizobiaceae bacterium]|nr:serine protease [Rhizobiaceae bacterium]
MFGQSPEVTTSIQGFLKSVTVPVIEALGDDDIDQVGTGTLFRVAGRLFLVTARHIFDDVRPENLCVPRSPDGDRNPHTLGPITVTKPTDSSIDIAIVEIHSPEAIARIETGWRILSLNMMRPASREALFALSGYPSELGKRPHAALVRSTLFIVETDRLDEIPASADKPVNPDLDLFFAYGRDGLKSNGRTMGAPHLRGASGASIWEFSQSAEQLWTPDGTLKIVGVQSSMDRNYDYFRAKSCLYLLEAFRQIDNEIASEVDKVRKQLKI